jgi:hypothetical protein
MSTSYTSFLANISQQVTIYVGLFLVVTGFIGGLLNIIVFFSLKTFRQSSCAFYLTIMSFVDTLQLFTGLFIFIMINGFGINWTDMSLFYCKFRAFYVQLHVSVWQQLISFLQLVLILDGINGITSDLLVLSS